MSLRKLVFPKFLQVSYTFSRDSGHKSVLSTMIYTKLVSFESVEYHIKTARNAKEDEDLIVAVLRIRDRNENQLNLK